MNAEATIRALTAFSLAGLLLGVGLRLSWAEVAVALRRCRISVLLAINFVCIPLLAVGLSLALGVEPRATTIGILLLAAAPFAPVVPVFTRMARADLALAAVLTSVVPLLSAFLTPVICFLSLRAFPGPGTETLDLRLGGSLAMLFGTIVLPMAIGLAMHHWWPRVRDRVLRPLEIVAEAAGAISLTFVTVVEFKGILSVGWKALLVTILVSEIGLLLGYAAGRGSLGSRRVTAFGTANRNIALALLLALQSFPGTPVAASVVAGGLTLILLGLLHVAWWRFVSPQHSNEGA